jgi:hypothetical protein
MAISVSANLLSRHIRMTRSILTLAEFGDDFAVLFGWLSALNVVVKHLHG